MAAKAEVKQIWEAREIDSPILTKRSLPNKWMRQIGITIRNGQGGYP